MLETIQTMSRIMKIDWKFLLMSLLALSGVVIPLIVSQLQVDKKSLKVRVFSTYSMEVDESESIPDLEVAIEGVTIKSPYMSKIE